MRYKNKVVIITGGAQGIGARAAERFTFEGAKVEIIDSNSLPGDWTRGDISDPKVLEEYAAYVVKKYGYVDILINNAAPLMKGINDCTWDDFVYAQLVGVAAPFYLTKLLKDYFREGSSVINISSTRDRMSQPGTESYAAAKGGIHALTHALAVSLGPKIRVNSISPGWIYTGANTLNEAKEISVEDMAQHPAGRIGIMDDVVSLIMFLCSEEAGFITAENIIVDGGMTRNMIYNNDLGWNFNYEKR